jgi:choline dehydrogenase-like flavoprotein
MEVEMPELATDYDVVVVGSGFGGSVTALRLTEKGYRVGVLEAGRRFTDDQLPKTSWDVRKFVWAPKLGYYGIQRIHLLRDCLILAGAGVGGGSLNYANTLYRPGAPFFNDPQWAHITDWKDELSPYYEQAKRMLGVVLNPDMTPADEIMKAIAEDMGVGDTFVQTPVGVFFGEPGKTVADPYFGGAGPERTVITLVMQNLDNSITTFTKRGLRGRHLTSKQGHGQPNPTWIPVGNEATRRIADKIDGVSAGSWGELFNIPMTAHFLGGCAIGSDPEHGVIDPYHRVYGYPTLSVVDGAAVSANLGVNPSLTIALKPSARPRCGPTKARATSEPSKGRHTAAYHRPRRTTPSCRKARRAHCDSRLSRSRPLARRVRAARKRDDASGSLWPILSRDQASVGV